MTGNLAIAMSAINAMLENERALQEYAPEFFNTTRYSCLKCARNALERVWEVNQQEEAKDYDLES